MIDVKFAELHNALFLNGKNFGLKLDPHRFPQLSLKYDKVEKELIVTWLDELAHVPCTNVAYYIPGLVKERKVVQISHPQVAGISSAQVETPYSHVQGGLGAGKNGKSK